MFRLLCSFIYRSLLNMTNPSIHYKYGADVGFFPTAMYKYRKEVSLFQFVKNQPIKPIRSLQLTFSHQPNRLAGVMAMMLASSAVDQESSRPTVIFCTELMISSWRKRYSSKARLLIGWIFATNSISQMTMDIFLFIFILSFPITGIDYIYVSLIL